jgi:hypothetical protein
MSNVSTEGAGGIPLRFGDGIAVAQARVARPTNQLEDVVRLYRDGLGLDGALWPRSGMPLSSHADMDGPLEPIADDTLRSHRTDRGIEDAYVTFRLDHGHIRSVETKPASLTPIR